MTPLMKRLLAKTIVNENTGCWEWTAHKQWDGYGAIQVGGKKKSAHRISYEIHCGPIPTGSVVCHRCDNKACVNPSHLFIGTQAENIADKHAKGREAPQRGSDNGYAKLTETDVLAIRSAEGMKHRELAAQYGVSRHQISNILRRKQWAHLEETTSELA